MAEIYRKDGEWRMNGLGAGYQGGLQALLISLPISLSQSSINNVQLTIG